MSSRFDKTSKEILGRFFREIRVRTNLSQEGVAKKLELKSAQFISNVERGVAFFSVAQLKKIVDIYDIEMSIVENIIIKELEASFFREWSQETFQEFNTPKKNDLHLKSGFKPI